MATLTAAAVSPRLADAAANRMLAAVSPDGLETLLAQALVLEVEPGDLLYEPQQTAPWVFFPLSCVVSIMPSTVYVAPPMMILPPASTNPYAGNAALTPA